MIGESAAEVRILARAFAVDRERRASLRAKGGLSPKAIEMLVGVYLAMTGLGAAATAWQLRGDPAAAAFATLAMSGGLGLMLAVAELAPLLLGEEGYRVVAAWPVRSASFLLARLAVPARRALVAAALLATPSAVLLAFVALPVLPGIALLAVALALGLLLLAVVAALLAGLVAVLGVRGARRAAVLVQLASALSPLLLVRLGSWLTGADPLASGTPLAWWASIPAFAAGVLPTHYLWMPLAALASFTLLPLVLLRLTARGYTRGLRGGRVETRRPRGALLYGFAWLRPFLGRPPDRVLLMLCAAHARHDWRFRAQAILVPVTVIALGGAALVGLPVERLLVDPFQRHGLWHPALIFVLIALWMPIGAVVPFYASADARASWIMTTGVIAADDLAASVRRLVRVGLIVPWVVVVAVAYLAAGVAPLSVARHALTLWLVAELVAVAIQRLLPRWPFSRESDDQELAQAMAAAMTTTYVTCALVAAAVVHVAYRFWPAHLLFALSLLGARAQMTTPVAPRKRPDQLPP